MKILKLTMIVALFFIMEGCNKENDCTGEGENEREIKVSELPLAVQEGVNEKFQGAQLIEADEIKHKDGKLTYDIEIKHENNEFEVMFDTQGNYLGTEIDDQDKEGDD